MKTTETLTDGLLEHLQLNTEAKLRRELMDAEVVILRRAITKEVKERLAEVKVLKRARRHLKEIKRKGEKPALG